MAGHRHPGQEVAGQPTARSRRPLRISAVRCRRARQSPCRSSLGREVQPESRPASSGSHPNPDQALRRHPPAASAPARARPQAVVSSHFRHTQFQQLQPPRACGCWIDRREHGRSLVGRLHFLKNLQKRRSNPTPIYGGRSRHPPLPLQVRTEQIKTTVCESPGLGGTMLVRHSHDLTDTNSAVRVPDT